MHVDYTTNVSTTNWKDNSSWNCYYRDWNPSGISWTSTNTTTHPVTGGYLNASLNTSGSAPYWQINLVATSAGDMTYTITLPVFDDKIYEGGSTGTAETINFKIYKSLALMNKNISTINNSNLFFKNLFSELGIFLIEK